jgi:hypothetical protein
MCLLRAWIAGMHQEADPVFSFLVSLPYPRAGASEG